MNTRSPLVRLLAAFTLAFALTAGQVGAQVTTFNDATNDIAPGIATAGGTLDIVDECFALRVLRQLCLQTDEFLKDARHPASRFASFA